MKAIEHILEHGSPLELVAFVLFAAACLAGIPAIVFAVWQTAGGDSE